MLQMIPRWKVTVGFVDRQIVMWVSDNFLNNVLRKLADFDFGATSLEQPTSIAISHEPEARAPAR